MKLTNKFNISLGLAVWLVDDDYSMTSDKVIPESKLISVTTLMKAPKPYYLNQRYQTTRDLVDGVTSKIGHGVHAGIEKAWSQTNYKANLRKLGYPEEIINRVKINPSCPSPDDIPIYLEIRGYMKFGDYVVTGCADRIEAGQLKDTKTTSTFAVTSDNKSKDYIKQGSCYRLLHEDKITSDTTIIEFVLKDWKKGLAEANPSYPQAPVIDKEYTLMSKAETIDYIKGRLALFDKVKDLPDDELPDCTPDELWMGEPEYKYYAKRESFLNGGRATKAFGTDKAAAEQYVATQGKLGGYLHTIDPTPKACEYCAAFDRCKQKDRYF